MAQDVTAGLENPQQIEAVVSGPDGANRLYFCTGIAPTYVQGAQVEGKESYVFSVGPALSRQQFIRATASVSLAQFQTFGMTGAPTQTAGQWRILGTDADWDDESGKVQARVELAASGSAEVYVYIGKIAYQVTILAEIA